MSVESRLRHLQDYTEQLTQHLHKVEYEQLEELVDLREDVLNGIQDGELTEEDRSRIQVLLSYDGPILSRMIELKEEASMALLKINQSRSQKNAYEQTSLQGSYFIDKRN
ncbi:MULTISPECIES: hypothetical protein [unclassified Paenibacillus]|uniref:hypothetical protein n=1 Tax=unclassified Paenibacillus TaxID=185978 RepID=UPI0009549C85|nr:MULTISPECIES: hypothetical protein [unclassified Paenibacillus]ASS67227.1 hypothetical protein CIC07_14575 [Paenibacillus sp. RUD330]SIQ85040.1 hypothetical protein SAMN05880555_2513 [Paenibacillus sp. RU4X]SIR05838.1 hypothetical protein SAMN05880570_2512 [Paenibacillus sp. RU4T]